jgi:uncharacterized protein (TIGR04255 family)
VIPIDPSAINPWWENINYTFPFEIDGRSFQDSWQMAVKTKLPSFKRPPLGEVILSLLFESLAKLDVRHAGLLADRFKERFPGFAVHPPLEPAIERFDGHRLGKQIAFQLADVPLFPRLWFIEAGGAELVQFQRDRLVHNWRAESARASSYPRYPVLRDAFASDWNVVSDFLRVHSLGELLPAQCEISYVNHIDARAATGGYRDPSEIFSFISPALGGVSQGQFEALTHSTSFRAAGESSSSQPLLGRLYAELVSAVSGKKGEPVYSLTLLLRGAPVGRDLDGVLDFFDFGHECIVKSFVELTTPEMHKDWGIEQ